MREPWIKQPAWLAEVPPDAPRRARRAPGLLNRPEGEHKRIEFAKGESGAVWGVDGPIVTDSNTPLSALLQAESIGGGLDRTALLADAMGYFYGEGPHPAHVMRRVFVLAEELDAALTSRLPVAERRWLRAQDSAAHHMRVSLVIRGTRIASRPPSRHDAVIAATLSAAAARMRSAPQSTPVDLRDLIGIRSDEELAEYEVRVERLRGLLRFIFYFGPQPEGVVRRVFCLAKWRPLTAALMLDMSLACLGVMFGETRATWSWRVKQVINRFLSAHHVRGTHSGFQRSEEACDHYAAAQRNNQNRRGGVPKVA